MSSDKTKIKLDDIKMCRPIPATDRDHEKFSTMYQKLVDVYGSVKDVPGVHVSSISNFGPLAFMLDTTDDIPERAKEVLNNYKPILVEG